MSDIEQELQRIEERTMARLKDFQLATVERVDKLFRNGQIRVLVADEVGLGKTLVARGVIAKTARMQDWETDPLFKVVYICSNLAIASQNIGKLDVFNNMLAGSYDDARLSMQHLKIVEQELYTKQHHDFSQLIPLTPQTSFNVKFGKGTKEERGLMFAILKRIDCLEPYIADIDCFLGQYAPSSWGCVKTAYENRVAALESTGTGYPASIIERVIAYDADVHLIENLIDYLEEDREKVGHKHNASDILSRLRRMFAELSVDMLQPDLVIMDEFQRFKFLIDSEAQESETGVISKKFFSTKGLKVLLLSATPYKLYSTMDEIDEASVDEHYKEFFQVIKFLLYDPGNSSDSGKMDAFKEIWSNYSASLREVKQGDTAILTLKKKAEDAMYGSICRTERLSVMQSGDYIDDGSVKRPVRITSGDIYSYLAMARLLQDIGEGYPLPIDYAKSCPYLMSFMNYYKVKETTEKYFKKYPEEVGKADNKGLWIDRNVIEHYGQFPLNNARLEDLIRRVFINRSELYMWVPPSMPYYPLEGVYKDSKGFSKILVFSAWEMVPRMIGSMVSYEAERRTVGVLSNNTGLGTTNNTYFSESRSRYPAPRLRFNVTAGEPRGMYLFCLLYPSETLVELYHPIEYMNAEYTLGEIREYLELKLDNLLKPIRRSYTADTVRVDNRWYYMASILLDGEEYATKWLEAMESEGADEDDTTEDVGSRGESGLRTHLNRLRQLIGEGKKLQLGKPPSDLTSVLADIAIGGFAVCAYRANGGDMRRASELAKIFINRFNSTEATAAVMLSYQNGDETREDGHWRNVLRYCCDGGFGSMLDEYVHMVSEGVGFGLSEEKNKIIYDNMVDALKIHTASYVVDTYPVFRSKATGEKAQGMRMRSHYAIAFATMKGETVDAKHVERKDSIRNAFNSPLRPFVLATTSIGQEGLDFHQYCRKIMHWNLPGNPIDLEQREGRINRYKCLAIRQDIAQQFAGRSFSEDVWQELFQMAAAEDRGPEQSELVPFWCLGKGQKVKIERIIPMYPISKDEVNYERLIQVLSLYRLTLGQARQEEIVNYLMENGFRDDKYLQKLFIDLSPYNRTDKDWRMHVTERKPVAVQKRKTERQRKIENLQQEKTKLSEGLSLLRKRLSLMPATKLEGMMVSHAKYGEGIVLSVEQSMYIKVCFDAGEKKFPLPGAFEDGYLLAGIPDFLENYQARAALEKQIAETADKLEAATTQLETLAV